MNHEGWKIGFIGIAEKDWIVTLSEFDPEDIEFMDANIVGEEYGKMLSRNSIDIETTHGCDLVIALTHMRVVNDCLFAGETSSIDLILGGHDHVEGAHLDVLPPAGEGQPGHQERG